MKLKIIFFSVLIMFFSGVLYAQEVAPKTNSTNFGVKVNRKKDRVKAPRYMKITEKNTKGILYGNKCFKQYTRTLGFEYTISVNIQWYQAIRYFIHNAAVKTVLVFTAGPWWKIEVNKHKKACRKLSGDFVG